MRSIGSACLRSTGNLESSPSEDHPRKDPEPSTLELPWMMACTTGIALSEDRKRYHCTYDISSRKNETKPEF